MVHSAELSTGVEGVAFPLGLRGEPGWFTEMTSKPSPRGACREERSGHTRGKWTLLVSASSEAQTWHTAKQPKGMHEAETKRLTVEWHVGKDIRKTDSRWFITQPGHA